MLQGLEFRRVLQLELHIKGQTHQQDGQQEGRAPGPGEEGLGRHSGPHDQEQEIGQDQAGRHPHLGEAAVKALAVGRGVLDGQQGCAAPLSAHRQTLQETQDDQDHRRRHADHRIPRQEAYSG